MKLTLKQAKKKMTLVWGKEAFVVPYRIAGNRYVYAITDHGEHWLPLESSWIQGDQVFALVGAEWPDPEVDLEQQRAQVKDWWQERRKREPEPVPGYWADAILDATQLARVYFMEQGNKAALKRLPRAQLIATLQNWQRVGDKFDTWLMPSSSGSGKVYMVNGRCSCPDTVAWCKHRIARALAKRATEYLREENRAGDDADSQAPQPQQAEQPLEEAATVIVNGQAQRIDLIVAYDADNAQVLPRINGNGQLVRFEADGEGAAPPVGTMPELYRWLQEHNYTPDDFKWLGWERGLRQRRQTYVRADARDTALPVQYSRGRSKLFKEERR